MGKLLRKGEQPTNYDDDEDDENVSSIDDTATVAAAAAAAATATAGTQDDGVRKRQPDRSKGSEAANGPNASITKAQQESTDC